ncbi:serine phosphatase RsbU, regulator of sigma subunit [Beggiatoa alba B18LD]|uniref:Serine phosphatase RsbU, regulator of sigma subunit n=1 Tax=Beggiatoa alba B18LD TaxID=395493 RepID=I3CCW6_9GAMM|nr:SpoIIE family protein phosphatase [Beggiatoa alba]EIJ41459.1 serine phosphatase RsbU, regulator of sigma subunit [Beggiatoa alba B18LD]
MTYTKTKLLLVEDCSSMRLVLQHWLKSYCDEILIATDGQEALTIFHEHPDINLVLTDWIMPKIDGLQLCQLIRQTELSHYVYVIVLTGKDERESSLVQGLNAGADDFLFKPIDPNKLRIRLQMAFRILGLEQTLAERNQKLFHTYEQIRQDLVLASVMQKNLLPAKGKRDEILFDWIFYPSHFIAGDIFNYFELTDDYLAFYHLDVAGHGVRSALLSFTLHQYITNKGGQTNFLSYKDEQGIDQPVPPEQVVTSLNQRFSDTGDLYFTMVYGYLHKATGVVEFTQAGHPCPILLRTKQHQAQFCGGSGFPVAMFPLAEYERLHLQLTEGDRLFIYSDGITECLNAVQQSYTEQRLLSLLQNTADQALEQTLQTLCSELFDWQGSGQFEDDMTLLAIEYHKKHE